MSRKKQASDWHKRHLTHLCIGFIMILPSIRVVVKGQGSGGRGLRE